MLLMGMQPFAALDAITRDVLHQELVRVAGAAPVDRVRHATCARPARPARRPHGRGLVGVVASGGVETAARERIESLYVSGSPRR